MSEEDTWNALSIPNWEHVWKVNDRLYYVDPRHMDRVTGQILINTLAIKYPEATIAVRQWRGRKELHEYGDD